MPDKHNLSCLFEPVEMPNLTLKNKLFMAPMGTGFDIEKTIPYLAARAKGGVSMITTGETCVHPSGRVGLKNEALLENDEHIKPMERLAESVKKEGTKIILQLNHAGRYSPGHAVGGKSVAPSAVLSGFTGETPRELSAAEIDDLVLCFVKAAKRAMEAGFDGVEFMGSSGYLISQFLSPLTNKRDDKYGGDTLGRAEFILAILRETRTFTGPDFNLCVKFDADDGMKGGITINESKIFAPALVKAGADRLNVWAGWHESARPMLTMSVKRGAFADLSAEIKNEVDVPVAIAGRINDPYTAAEIVTEKHADMIGIARGLLADPEFVNKISEDRINEINKCTACCHCFDILLSGMRTGKSGELRCMVNPELGKESEKISLKTDHPKNVIIVGAGPAGLETALRVSARGHRVIVYEKENRIGGMLNLSVIPPFKDELKNLLDYHSHQVELKNIEIKLNSFMTADKIRGLKPDAVVIATGSEISANLPGIEMEHIVTATEVLKGVSVSGNTVLVIGGGMIGLETAEWLSDNRKDVTVIESDRIASDIGPTNRWAFISRIRSKLKILSSTTVLRITQNGVIILDKDNNEKEIKADSIMIATGMKSINQLAEELTGMGIECYIAGSASKPGMIDDAIKDGYEIGNKIR